MQRRNSLPPVSAGMSRFPHRMRGWRRFVVAAPLVGVSMVSSSECVAGLVTFDGNVPHPGVSIFDFDGGGLGDVRMWNLSTSNNLTAVAGGRAAAIGESVALMVPPVEFGFSDSPVLHDLGSGRCLTP